MQRIEGITFDDKNQEIFGTGFGKLLRNFEYWTHMEVSYKKMSLTFILLTIILNDNAQNM